MKQAHQGKSHLLVIPPPTYSPGSAPSAKLLTSSESGKQTVTLTVGKLQSPVKIVNSGYQPLLPSTAKASGQLGKLQAQAVKICVVSAENVKISCSQAHTTESKPRHTFNVLDPRLYGMSQAPRTQIRPLVHTTMSTSTTLSTPPRLQPKPPATSVNRVNNQASSVTNKTSSVSQASSVTNQASRVIKQASSVMNQASSVTNQASRVQHASDQKAFSQSLQSIASAAHSAAQSLNTKPGQIGLSPQQNAARQLLQSAKQQSPIIMTNQRVPYTFCQVPSRPQYRHYTIPSTVKHGYILSNARFVQQQGPHSPVQPRSPLLFPHQSGLSPARYKSPQAGLPNLRGQPPMGFYTAVPSSTKESPGHLTPNAVDLSHHTKEAVGKQPSQKEGEPNTKTTPSQRQSKDEHSKDGKLTLQSKQPVAGDKSDQRKPSSTRKTAESSKQLKDSGTKSQSKRPSTEVTRSKKSVQKSEKIQPTALNTRSQAKARSSPAVNVKRKVSFTPPKPSSSSTDKSKASVGHAHKAGLGNLNQSVNSKSKEQSLVGSKSQAARSPSSTMKLVKTKKGGKQDITARPEPVAAQCKQAERSLIDKKQPEKRSDKLKGTWNEATVSKQSTKVNQNKIPPLEPVVLVLKREIQQAAAKSSSSHKQREKKVDDYTYTVSVKSKESEPHKQPSPRDSSSVKAPLDKSEVEVKDECAKLDQSGKTMQDLALQGYRIALETFNTLDEGVIGSDEIKEEPSNTESSGIGTGMEDFSGEELNDSGLQVVGNIVPKSKAPLDQHPSEVSALEQKQLDEDTTLEMADRSEVVPVEETSGEIIHDLVVTGKKVSLCKSNTALDLTDGEVDEVFEEDMVKGDTYNASQLSQLYVQGDGVTLNVLQSHANDKSDLPMSEVIATTLLDARNFKNSLESKLNTVRDHNTMEGVSDLLAKASRSAGNVVRTLNKVLQEIEHNFNKRSSPDKPAKKSDAAVFGDSDRESSPLVTKSLDESIKEILKYLDTPESRESETSNGNMSTSVNRSQPIPKTPQPAVGMDDSIRVINNNSSDNLTNLSAEFSSDDPPSPEETRAGVKDAIAQKTNKHFVTLQDQQPQDRSALITRNVFISPCKDKLGFKTRTSLEKSVTFDEGLSNSSTECPPKTSTPKMKESEDKGHQKPDGNATNESGKEMAQGKDATHTKVTVPYHPGWNFDCFVNLESKHSLINKYKIPRVTKPSKPSIDSLKGKFTKVIHNDESTSRFPSRESPSSSSSASDTVTPPSTRGHPQKRKRRSSRILTQKEREGSFHKTPLRHSNRCHPLLIDKSINNICRMKRIQTKRHCNEKVSEQQSPEVVGAMKARGIRDREKCFEILNAVYNYKESDILCMEISSEDIPDYYSVVKYPMCLDVIARKLRTQVYNCLEEFVSDFRRVFYNCRLYYKDPHCQERFSCAMTEGLFEKMLKSTFPNENFTAITGSPPHGKRQATSNNQDAMDVSFSETPTVSGLLKKLLL